MRPQLSPSSRIVASPIVVNALRGWSAWRRLNRVAREISRTRRVPIPVAREIAANELRYWLDAAHIYATRIGT